METWTLCYLIARETSHSLSDTLVTHFLRDWMCWVEGTCLMLGIGIWITLRYAQRNGELQLNETVCGRETSKAVWNLSISVWVAQDATVSIAGYLCRSEQYALICWWCTLRWDIPHACNFCRYPTKTPQIFFFSITSVNSSWLRIRKAVSQVFQSFIWPTKPSALNP